jgi:hypothetical protein
MLNLSKVLTEILDSYYTLDNLKCNIGDHGWPITTTDTWKNDDPIQPNTHCMARNEPGTLEGKGMLTITMDNHPENTQATTPTSLFGARGSEWHGFDDGQCQLEEEENDYPSVKNKLIGRELQTLEDLRKMTSRLRQRGLPESDIEDFIIHYLTT